MKINFSKPLHDAYGKPMKDDATGNQILLGVVCITALNCGLDIDNSEEAKAKSERFVMACAVAGSETSLKPIELTPDQVAIIRSRLAKVYPAGIVGPAFKLLDSAA